MGKMCIRACCYVTCNYQSKPSVHTHLDEYVKALSWKNRVPHHSGATASLGLAHLYLGVFFLFLINLLLPQIKPQILIKTWGTQGSILFSTPQIWKQKIEYHGLSHWVDKTCLQIMVANPFFLPLDLRSQVSYTQLTFIDSKIYTTYVPIQLYDNQWFF